MTRDKEKELELGEEMITREQKKKKEQTDDIFKGKPKATADSQVSIKKSQNSANSIKKNINNKISGLNNGLLAIDEFSLPENKKSLGGKPFTIIVPGREPITESQPPQNVINKTVEEESKAGVRKCATIEITKSLIMEILESPALKTGTTFKINSEGLENSKRNAKDNISFFGVYSGNEDRKSVV